MPVVHHDKRLERCTNGTGYLRDHTMEQLEQLDASAYFSREAAGERIPRLTDVLQLARSLGLGINVEVKHLTEREIDVPTAHEKEMEEELAHAVCDAIEHCGMAPSEVVFSSYSRPAIAVLFRRLPDHSRAFLVEDIPADWEDFMAEFQCGALNFWCEAPGNSQAVIEQCARKASIYCYTVNDPGLASNLLSWGVCGLFSDQPQAISEALEAGGHVSPLLLSPRENQRNDDGGGESR